MKFTLQTLNLHQLHCFETLSISTIECESLIHKTIPIDIQIVNLRYDSRGEIWQQSEGSGK